MKEEYDEGYYRLGYLEDDSIAAKGMSCEAGSGRSTKGRGQEAGEEEKAKEEVGSSLLLLVFYMYDRLGSELAVGR